MAENTLNNTAHNNQNTILRNMIDFILFAFILIAGSALLYSALTAYLFNASAQERPGQLGGGYDSAYESNGR